jgi:hypothetical protein
MANLRAIISVVLLSILFSLSSCSDDTPVSSNNNIALDTPRYDWKVDTIGYFVRRIWAPDTNDVFFLSPNTLVHSSKNGIDYTPLPNISARSISGIDKNNIFIGGQDLTTGNAKLLIYDGGVFTEYILNGTHSSNSSIDEICVKDRADVWLGSFDGYIYHYTGSQIEQFLVDSSFIIGGFLKDTQGNFYMHIASRGTPGPNPADSVAYLKVFVYTNNVWKLIDSIRSAHDDVPFFPRNVSSGEALSTSHEGFYKYNFPGYTKLVSFNGFGSDISWTGISSSNLLCPGGLAYNASGLHSLFHWDGISWSDEKEYCGPSYYWIQSFNVQNKYYVSFCDWSMNFKTVIFTGTKK